MDHAAFALGLRELGSLQDGDMVEADTLSSAVIAPAVMPSAPACTSSRNTSRRASWASALSPLTTRIKFFMFNTFIFINIEISHQVT